MLITYEAGTAALKEHYTALWEIVTGAWNEWSALPSNVLFKATPRSKASLTHDFMVHNAIEMTTGSPDIWFTIYRGMFTLGFESPEGVIAVRLKKFDEAALSKNNLTQQVSDFRNQIPLVGIPAKHHLEVGYILNATGDKIQSIELVCPSGIKANYWQAEISKNALTELTPPLWENQGKDEQLNTGFTVKRRVLPGDLQGEDNGQSNITKTGTDSL